MLDVNGDSTGQYGFVFIASDCTNLAYSFSGGRVFSASNDTAAAEAGTGQVLVLGPGALPGPRRARLQVPAGMSSGYWSNTDIAAVLLGGGVDVATGALLSDVWVSRLLMTCRGKRHKATRLLHALPRLRARRLRTLGGVLAALICDAGWDVATNCSSCLPGVACYPPPPELTGLSMRHVALAAGGAAVSAALVVGAAFGWVRRRRRIRAARGAAEYDVFVSDDWAQGGARADTITTRLRAGGLRVWRDREDMRQHMLVSMVSGVQTARAAVLLVTRAYVRSANCRLQAEQVLVRARSQGLPFLLVRAGSGSGADSGSGGSKTGGAATNDVEVDLDSLPDSHPVVRLALLAPRAVVRFADTFGDEGWCRAMIDAFADGAAVAGAAAPATGAPADGVAAAGGAGQSPAVAGWRAVSGIFQRAAAPISLVYFEEHDAIMRPLRAGLEAAGWRVNIWAHPTASASLHITLVVINICRSRLYLLYLSCFPTMSLPHPCALRHCH